MIQDLTLDNKKRRRKQKLKNRKFNPSFYGSPNRASKKIGVTKIKSRLRKKIRHGK